MNKAALVILAALSVSIALADDFKTVDGKEYKNAKVSRVEPDGIVITFSGGIVKIPFTKLSEELQRKYNYNPEAAKSFAEQTDNIKRDQNEGAAQELEDARKRATPAAVELKYDPPEELAGDARKATRAKMFSPEEENGELAKIPPGGALEVKLYAISIGAANPKWLKYIISNSAGEYSNESKVIPSCPHTRVNFGGRGLITLNFLHSMIHSACESTTSFLAISVIMLFRVMGSLSAFDEKSPLAAV
jgi:Uncharacterized FAD-dependent dehydrogenases